MQRARTSLLAISGVVAIQVSLLMLAPQRAHAAEIFDNFEEFWQAAISVGGDPSVRCSFDPAFETTVVSGRDGATGCHYIFRSPEGSDPTLVYLVGDPTGNGCVAGIREGSNLADGSLWIIFGPVGIVSAGLDIRSTSSTPITIRVLDSEYDEVASAIGPTTFVGVVAQREIFAIEVTPGMLGDGERDPTCFDNLRIGVAPLPTRPATWGRVKAERR